jgi:hypothetical protein
MRKDAQLFIDNGIQLIERRSIASAYRLQQSIDRVVRPRIHRSISVTTVLP